MVTVNCRRCRRDREHHALGECVPCYHRRFAPPTGVGSGAPGVLKTRAICAGRAEDIAELGGQGEDIRMIAQRLGVSVRTVQRYRSREDTR